MGLQKYFRAVLDVLRVLGSGSASWNIKWAVVKAILQLKTASKKQETLADFQFLQHNYTVSNPSDCQFLLKEIWLEQPYALPSSNRISSIADVGANQGFSFHYFKTQFPHAAIHAFEPDRLNFSLLEKNSAGIMSEKDTLHPVAVWHENTTLFAADSSAAPSNHSFVEKAAAQETGVAAIDFGAWLQEQKPDLVKMDIEGAEAEVLPRLISIGAVSIVPYWLVEFHPGTYGPTVELEISKGFEQLGFQVERRGIIRFYSKKNAG